MAEVLHKIKRPAGDFTFSVSPQHTDRFGTWLLAPRGSAWTAPHDRGDLFCDVLLLVGEQRNHVTWWVADPADRRVEVDVCLPPTRTWDGWRFVDLELDVIRHADGRVTLDDEDEFDIACDQGWIDTADADTARRAAAALVDALRRRADPWDELGWNHLTTALERRPWTGRADRQSPR